MRDRLIELLCKSGVSFEYATPQEIADHLLAAGVIVPPVALGSRHKIYYPVKGTNAVYETKVYGIGVDEDGDMIINPAEYHEKVIEMRGVTLGKDVFLTHEEAEKALAERRASDGT